MLARHLICRSICLPAFPSNVITIVEGGAQDFLAVVQFVKLSCSIHANAGRCAQVGVDNIRAHMEKHAAEAEALAKRRLELSRQARLRCWALGLAAVCHAQPAAGCVLFL